MTTLEEIACMICGSTYESDAGDEGPLLCCDCIDDQASRWRNGGAVAPDPTPPIAIHALERAVFALRDAHPEATIRQVVINSGMLAELFEALERARRVA